MSSSSSSSLFHTVYIDQQRKRHPEAMQLSIIRKNICTVAKEAKATSWPLSYLFKNRQRVQDTEKNDNNLSHDQVVESSTLNRIYREKMIIIIMIVTIIRITVQERKSNYSARTGYLEETLYVYSFKSLSTLNITPFSPKILFSLSKIIRLFETVFVDDCRTKQKITREDPKTKRKLQLTYG